MENRETIPYDKALDSTIKYFNGDELAAKVWIDKYALRNEKGELLECTPTDMHHRLTKEFARIESKYPNPLAYKEIFSFFENFNRCVPQGSPMSSIGDPFRIKSSGNCFILEEVHDSYGGILYTDQQIVQLSKRRCGVGFDISNLRPRGTPTKNSAITTDGISVFMERFSNSIREAGQNGRRGALILTISVHHPEILTFIKIKENLTKVTGANISIRFSDEFMKAVKEDTEVELRYPVVPVKGTKPLISTKVRARDIWKEFIHSSWKCAEPGALFWDTMNEFSPANPYGKVDKRFGNVGVNPCITRSAWVLTSEGPKQVKDLIGKKFIAIVHGKEYESSNLGFFPTGKKTTYKLKLKNGMELELTEDHKVETTRGMVSANSLTKEDIITINNSRDISWGGEGNYIEGYLLGSLLGDGCFNSSSAILEFWGKNKGIMAKKCKDMLYELYKNEQHNYEINETTKNYTERDRVRIFSSDLKRLANEYGITTNKRLDSSIEEKSSQFYCGFLCGWFDADGTINNKHRNQRDIRLCSVIEENLIIAQRMLSRLGIISRIYYRKPPGMKFLPDGKGGEKEYKCKSVYELIVSSESIGEYAKRIGFLDIDKNIKIKKLSSGYIKGMYKDKCTSKFESLTPTGKEEDVFDCTIPVVHKFDANGMIISNCGEIPAGVDSCRLLCIPLYSHILNKFTEKSKLDKTKFKETVRIAQRLMDDMVDLELEMILRIIDKVNSDPEPQKIKQVELDMWKSYQETCKMGRRTGLGLTGLGDSIAALGMRYGSEESIKFTEEVYKTLAQEAYRSSIELAKERGHFEIWDKKLEVGNKYLDRVLDSDKELREAHNKYGRRNIALLTSAPTGTISILTGTSSGIEPVFSLSFTRRKKINDSDKNVRVDFVDKTGDRWQEYQVYHRPFKEWMETSGKSDVKDSPYHKATANDIDWEASVTIQSVAQKWIDHSISKTCNLPKNTTKDLVDKIYLKAWEEKCKGFTIYRDGCRDGVLVTTPKKPEGIEYHHAPKRTKELPCDLYCFKVRGDRFLVAVGLLESKPYEVFACKIEHDGFHNKKGIISKIARGKYSISVEDGKNEKILIEDTTKSLLHEEETITRLVSTSLRHGVNVSYVVQQLEKVIDNEKCPINSIMSAIVKSLKKYISEGEKITGQKCPKCESENLTRSEGCLTCTMCGYSKCSS